jgi:MFS superfamily sulfate permease-like transporter
MNKHLHRPSRELLLGIAAFCLSLVSALWFMWAAFTNGTLGNPAMDSFPDVLQRAATVGLLLCVIGALCISPFWRSTPSRLGTVAAAHYLLVSALFVFDARGVRGFFFWFGASFIVFLIFYGFTRLGRILRPLKVT